MAPRPPQVETRSAPGAFRMGDLFFPLVRARTFAAVAGAALFAANFAAARLPLRGGADPLPPDPEIAALAARHAPEIWQDPALPGGPLREMLWEARRAGTRISILYRTVWNDEVHPVALLNKLYRMFRRLYYGSAKDVEYVRVDVDLGAGGAERVVAVAFQTEARGRAAPLFSRHAPAVIAHPSAPPAFVVLTWNHLLAPLGEPSGRLVRQSPRLRPLGDADRRALCLGRRTYEELADFGSRDVALEAALLGGAVLGAGAAAPLVWRARRRMDRNTSSAL